MELGVVRGLRDLRVPEVRIDLVGVRLDRRGDARFEHARGVG